MTPSSISISISSSTKNGIAFGAAREQVAQRRGHRRQPVEQRLDQLARAALGERREIDAQVLAPAAAPERRGARNSAGRVRHSSSSGRSAHACARWLTKSSEPSSAQCRSSSRIDDRLAGVAVDGAKVRGERVEGAVADLLGVGGDRRRCAGVGEVEADQLRRSAAVCSAARSPSTAPRPATSLACATDCGSLSRISKRHASRSRNRP